MKRKSIFSFIAIVAIVALALVGCSGKKGSSSGSVESSSQSVSGGSGLNNNLFNIPKGEIRFGSNVDRDTVLAEIPVEFLKGVGKIDTVDVWKDTITDFKYVVTFDFTVKSAEDAVKILMDYYRSVGATVEETGNRFNPYSVKFSWGESTEISASSFEGREYIKAQFSVVKK